MFRINWLVLWLATISPLIHFSCHLQEMSQDITFWPGLSTIDTGMPDDLLTLWNCFIDFAVEHWFSCCATESGYAGDIGAIEIWLIDWYNVWSNIDEIKWSLFVFICRCEWWQLNCSTQCSSCACLQVVSQKEFVCISGLKLKVFLGIDTDFPKNLLHSLS